MNTPAPEAFGQRLAECRGDVLRFVMSRTQNDLTLAEEITQDTMVRALMSRDRFQGDITQHCFVSWLFAIAFNVLRMRLRYKNYRVMISTDEPKRDDRGKRARIELRCTRPDQFAVLLDREKADLLPAVQVSMAALPERHRVCITMFYFDNLNLREIGERLGIAESTVYHRINRGIEQMAADCLHVRTRKTKKPPMRATHSRAKTEPVKEEMSELYRTLVARRVLLFDNGAA